MDKQPEQPQEEYAYNMPPACQVNLNINITELPKCTKEGCNGSIAPLQWTTNPRSNYSTVICVAWVCLSCGTNVMYANGKIVTQPILMDVNTPI